MAVNPVRTVSTVIQPVIVVHGGAWSIPDKLAVASRQGVRKAAMIGHAVLTVGGSAMDAVEKAVNALEDDPTFDAGTGSRFNSKGDIEMDAVVMSGKDLRTGAVACVKNIKNPVSLARHVMDETEHILLVGEGANEFASELNIPQVDPASLLSEEAKEEYEQYKQFKESVDKLINQPQNIVNPTSTQVSSTRKLSKRERTSSKDIEPIPESIVFSTNGKGDEDEEEFPVFRGMRRESFHLHDTVGAVALDRYGNLACATSTGGITAKRPGRVGDSPIVGAGAYADNLIGAVSTTGHGESISKVCLAHRVITNIRFGMTVEDAAKEALEFMAKRVKGSGGLIVLTPNGDVCKRFTTKRMAWATIKGGVMQHGLEPGENTVECVNCGDHGAAAHE